MHVSQSMQRPALYSAALKKQKNSKEEDQFVSNEQETWNILFLEKAKRLSKVVISMDVLLEKDKGN